MVSRWEWDYSGRSSENYNIAGAFEVAILNLRIVAYDDQWGMDEMENYANNILRRDDE